MTALAPAATALRRGQQRAPTARAELADRGGVRLAAPREMRHRLAACCLATLLALAASEQQPPWEHDDSGQERQRPRVRPMGRTPRPAARDMRPAVQRWARPANVANGALLVVSGLPVAMRGGLLNVQPIGLLLGGWVYGRPPTTHTAASATMHPSPERRALPYPKHCAQPGALRSTGAGWATRRLPHRTGLALWPAAPPGRGAAQAGARLAAAQLRLLLHW